MIRLPRESSLLTPLEGLLPKDPTEVIITSYEDVHRDILTPSSFSLTQASASGAFIPEEISPTDFVGDVIIGDDNFSRCLPHSETNVVFGASVGEQTTAPTLRRIKSSAETTIIDMTSSFPSSMTSMTEKRSVGKEQQTHGVMDGILAPQTNYTAFIEVQVVGANGKLMSARSDYFTPVLTGVFIAPTPGNFSESPFAPILSSMTSLSANSVVFGVTSGFSCIIFLLVLVLCFVKRKVTESTTDSDTQSEDNPPEETATTQSHKSNPDMNGVESPSDSCTTTAIMMNPSCLTSSGNIIPNECLSIFSQNPVSGDICSHPSMLPNTCHCNWIGQPLYIPDMPLVFLERPDDSSLMFQPGFEGLPADGNLFIPPEFQSFPVNCQPGFESPPELPPEFQPHFSSIPVQMEAIANEETVMTSDLLENRDKNRYPDMNQAQGRLPIIEEIPYGGDFSC